MFASISHPGGVLKGVLEANGFLLGLTFRKPVFGPSKNVVKRNYFHVLLKKVQIAYLQTVYSFDDVWVSTGVCPIPIYSLFII